MSSKPSVPQAARFDSHALMSDSATETDHSMRQRVEHDLYYIDNWSLLFDVYIIALTVLSRKTFRNAY